MKVIEMRKGTNGIFTPTRIINEPDIKKEKPKRKPIARKPKRISSRCVSPISVLKAVEEVGEQILADYDEVCRIFGFKKR